MVSFTSHEKLMFCQLIFAGHFGFNTKNDGNNCHWKYTQYTNIICFVAGLVQQYWPPSHYKEDPLDIIVYFLNGEFYQEYYIFLFFDTLDKIVKMNAIKKYTEKAK